MILDILYVALCLSRNQRFKFFPHLTYLLIIFNWKSNLQQYNNKRPLSEPAPAHPALVEFRG